jgi:type VI secretion system protein ImpA
MLDKRFLKPGATVRLPLDELLEPVTGGQPLGVPLRARDEFDALRTIFDGLRSPPPITENYSLNDEQEFRVNWRQAKEQALELARNGRDLRVWVWLARIGLVTNGLPGLADGLELIGRGLERYWDTVQPLNPTATNPRERFRGRVSALTELGITNWEAGLDKLNGSGRTIGKLRADLDQMVEDSRPNEVTREIAASCYEAIRRIADVFQRGFGENADPRLGFELILDTIQRAEAKVAAADPGGRVGPPEPGTEALADSGIGLTREDADKVRPVRGRDDVVHVLGLVLDYYRANEPSSPVPLLVERARRLVSASFVDALKELAPDGLKQLQTVAGVTIADTG